VLFSIGVDPMIVTIVDLLEIKMAFLLLESPAILSVLFDVICSECGQKRRER